MPDTLAPTDEIFTDPGYGERLTDWTRAGISSSDYSTQLFETMCANRADDLKSKRQIRDDVADIIESVTDDPDSFYHDTLDEKEKRLLSERDRAKEGQSAAATELIAYCEANGLNQFALFGLRHHLRYNNSPTNLTDNVKTTEQRLQTIDTAVKENAGNTLTVINWFGPQATNLTEGGIAIIDEKVVLPKDPEEIVFEMALSEDMPDVYEDNRLLIDAHVFASNNPVILPTSELLRLSNWRNRTKDVTFAFGEPVDGPPIIDREDAKSIEYLTMVFNRVRTVGALAAANQR